MSSTVQTPLLSSSEKNVSNTTGAMTSNISTSNNNKEQELQFYDPTAILGISREVAFGYLILLTGGAVKYEPPKPEDVLSGQRQAATNSQSPILDEENASLAYAAIVDGNLLHACFGLKASANGQIRNAVPTIGGKNNSSSSILCCFPTSSATFDALQLVLPHAAKNKLRMNNLVEMLREVRDLHYETIGTTEGTKDTSKVPVYINVIQAYVCCFTSVVRYQDSKQYTKKGSSNSKGNRSKEEGGMCSKLVKKLNRLFSKSKSNPQLDLLQRDTLADIENGFLGLREAIWESLERMATQTAFTTVPSREE